MADSSARSAPKGESSITQRQPPPTNRLKDPRLANGQPPPSKPGDKEKLQPPQPWRDRPRGPAPADVSTNNWTNLFPTLYEVSTVSSTDAWAVGEYGHLMHYTGGSWVAVDPANLSGLYNASDIDMLSSSVGWISGGYTAFEYDGTQWNERNNGLSNLYLGRISALSADDVWGVGHNYNNNRDTLIHWDGTQWSVTGPVLANTDNLTDIQMVSSTEGWAVGYGYNSIVLHYNGTTWTQVSGSPGVDSVENVSVPAPSDVWITGIINYNEPVIYHYDGNTWTSYSDAGGGAIFMLSPSEGWAVNSSDLTHGPGIYYWDGTQWTLEYDPNSSVAGLSGVSGQIWAVGTADNIWGRDSGGSWVRQSGGPTTYYLTSAVSAVNPNDAWATDGYGEVLHFDGSTWQTISYTGTRAYLNDIQMLSSTDGYAVGGYTYPETGHIVHWDGTSWNTVALTDKWVNGLYMLGSGNGWAVGGGGSILRDTNDEWAAVSSPVTETLNAVAMDSPTHGWAVGGGQDPYTGGTYTVVLEYDGTNWVNRTSTLPAGSPLLFDIVLDPGGSSGWAVGDYDWYNGGLYSILRLNNGTWSLDTNSPQHGRFRTVTLDATNSAWAVGIGMYRYTGTTWEVQILPTDFSNFLSGLTFTQGVRGWAVGSNDEILQYDAPNVTPTPTTTGTPPSATATATATVTSTPVHFGDVPPGSTFYTYIECLVSRGIINGYPCGGVGEPCDPNNDPYFRPGNNVTRGQFAKIASNSAGFVDPPGAQQYEDVAVGSTYFDFIWRLSNRGLINGYPCGGAGEPCGTDNLPYFRPNSNITRGQIAKIDSNAAGYADTPGAQQYEDVLPGSTFYDFIWRLADRGLVSGYPCGGAGEPCGPNNLPYFRPSANATRGQASKIVSNTFFPACNVGIK